MITEIIKVNNEYEFVVGKTKYKCSDYVSLSEIRAEFLQKQKQR